MFVCDQISDSDDESDVDSGSENSDNEDTDSTISTLAEEDESALSMISVTTRDSDASSDRSAPADGVRLRHPSSRIHRTNMPSVVLEEKDEAGSENRCLSDGRRPLSIISSSSADPKVESLFSSVMRQLETKLTLVKAALNLTPLSQPKGNSLRRFSPDRRGLNHSISDTGILYGEGKGRRTVDRSLSSPVERSATELNANRDILPRSRQTGKAVQSSANRVLAENLRWHPSSGKGLVKRKEWGKRRFQSLVEVPGQDEEKAIEDVKILVQSLVDTVVAVEEACLNAPNHCDRHHVLMDFWRKESQKSLSSEGLEEDRKERPPRPGSVSQRSVVRTETFLH